MSRQAVPLDQSHGSHNTLGARQCGRLGAHDQASLADLRPQIILLRRHACLGRNQHPFRQNAAGCGLTPHHPLVRDPAERIRYH